MISLQRKANSCLFAETGGSGLVSLLPSRMAEVETMLEIAERILITERIVRTGLRLREVLGYSTEDGEEEYVPD